MEIKKANFLKVCTDHLARVQTVSILSSEDEERHLRITKCLTQQREFLIHHAINEYKMQPFQSLKEFVANSNQNNETIDLSVDNIDASSNDTNDQTVQSPSNASLSIAHDADLFRIDAFLTSPHQFSVDTQHWSQDDINKLNSSGINHETAGSLKNF